MLSAEAELNTKLNLTEKQSNITKYLLVLAGAAMYSVGLTFFVTPHNLFTGGIMGFAQVIRSALAMFTPLNLPEGFDLSGIIYYIINIPLFIIAYKVISKAFFFKTLLSKTAITVLLSVIPTPEPIVADRLTSCIVGGLIVGIGIGFMLRSGGSGGGLDIVGMYLTKKYNDASVGKVALICNIILYILCALLFNVETAIYSIIYTSVSSLTLDKIHYQNIMIRVMIFTKEEGVAEPIMTQLGRGVTEWQGDGAYTHEAEHILVSVVSKYEMNQLRRLVHEVDPHAFITYDQISSIDGNFKKKL